MGKQIEMVGKTVDEAIFRGLQEIGLSIDEVDIDIIQKGSLGLLGIGAKPAKVRLTQKENYGLDVKGLFENDDEKTETEDVRPVKPDRKPYTKTENHEPAHSFYDRQTANPLHTDDPAEQSDIVSDKSEEAVISVSEEINYSEEAAKNNGAAQFLSGLLDKMGVEGKVLAAESEESLKLRIDTDAAGVLIGHRGETLDALQYLTLLVANRERGQREYTRVAIDTQGYREKREEVLIRLAKSKAATVRATGRSYKFEPMSPYERRIIHSTLQANPQVTTHSEGAEPYRYVVITSVHGQRRRQPRRRAPHTEVEAE